MERQTFFKKSVIVLSAIGVGAIAVNAAPFHNAGSTLVRMSKRDNNTSSFSLSTANTTSVADSIVTGQSTPIAPPLFWFQVPGITVDEPSNTDTGSSTTATDGSSTTQTEQNFVTATYTDENGSVMYTIEPVTDAYGFASITENCIYTPTTAAEPTPSVEGDQTVYVPASVQEDGTVYPTVYPTGYEQPTSVAADTSVQPTAIVYQTPNVAPYNEVNHGGYPVPPPPPMKPAPDAQAAYAGPTAYAVPKGYTAPTGYA